MLQTIWKTYIRKKKQVWFSLNFAKVGLGETLLEAENIEDQESPVNCFRKLFGKNIILFQN